METPSAHFSPSDPSARQAFEDLLVLNAQGQCPELEATINQILEAEKDISHFLTLLFDVMKFSENKQAFIQSIVYAPFFIQKYWDNLPQDLKNCILTTVTSIYEKVDDDSLYIYTQLIMYLAKAGNQPYLSDFAYKLVNDDKSFRFYLLLIFSQLQVENFNTLENWYENIVELLMKGLTDSNPKTNIISIRILSRLLEYFPDEKEHTHEHLQIIENLAENSEKLEPLDFINFWKALNSLCNCSAADPDFVTIFHPAINKILKLNTIPADYKIYPLRSIWNAAGEYDRPVVRDILAIASRIAIEYFEQSQDLPFEFLYVYEESCKIFEHEITYQVTKQRIMEFLENENPASQIVGLCLMKIVISLLPHQAYRDIEYYINVIDSSLKKDEAPLSHFYLSLACMIICSFGKLFAWNLVDFEMFLPLTSPLIIHQHPDVRFHAVHAMNHILSVSDTPIPRISLMMFRLLPHVNCEEIRPYLMLLGKAIKRENCLENEITTHIANFTLAMLNNNNSEMIGGACYVAECLMSADEDSHTLLCEATMKAIEFLLTFENYYDKLFGIDRLHDFLKLFPEKGTEILKKHQEVINQILNIDEQQFSLVKQEAAIRIAAIESFNLDISHPFGPKLMELTQSWLSNDQPSFNGTSIAILKKLTPILPKETFVSTFNALADIAYRSKSMEIVCKSMKAMSHVFKMSPDEIKPLIAQTGYQIGVYYIQGELAVLDGVSPVGTDFDFDLLFEISNMVRELFGVPNEIMRVYFPFSCSIIERNNSLKTEITLFVWVSAIEQKAFNEEELIFVKNYALTLFVEDIPHELMLAETNLLIALLDAKLVEFEAINSKIDVLNKWWERCNDLHHMMKITIANIVLLVWKIAFYFDARKMMDPLILRTFDQYPPDDVGRTAEMTSLLLMCYDKEAAASINKPPSSPDLAMRGAISIMKILLMPKLILKKRNVTDDLIEKLQATLYALKERYPNVQSMINNFANKSGSRQEIFAQFIK
ncbi:hypothetical protein TRFO_07748 [Tritrichomonas foetus]|uniref:Importin N-terminal domain-containing protein n=1 Tax=Tritrichomonas foetus TaxID=1144522 RepID=A0A1J4JTC2_9EUKA|nr:hypothetical protein TRFO_07748 [Tritrichomonas foetus]|eukprot:OHT00774.1 hypothetical protein TRFO_07748 [Tritrichomonas foetus]